MKDKMIFCHFWDDPNNGDIGMQTTNINLFQNKDLKDYLPYQIVVKEPFIGTLTRAWFFKTKSQMHTFIDEFFSAHTYARANFNSKGIEMSLIKIIPEAWSKEKFDYHIRTGFNAQIEWLRKFRRFIEQHGLQEDFAKRAEEITSQEVWHRYQELMH